eukprot:PRCOL_00003836-RA
MAGAGAASAAGRGARGGFEWPAGRRWALSLSWDGGAYANFRGAAPALEACGVRGTFYIVGDMCEIRRGKGVWRMLPPLREWCHRHLGTARGDAAYRCVRRCLWLYACVYLYVRYAVVCALFTPLSVRTWECMENFVTEVLRYDLWMLAVRKMSERGHEIGNHTFSHPCSARKGALTAGNELENYTVDQVEADTLRANHNIVHDLGAPHPPSLAVPCGECVCGEGTRAQCFTERVARHFSAAFSKMPDDPELHGWEDTRAHLDKFILDPTLPAAADVDRGLRHIDRLNVDGADVVAEVFPLFEEASAMAEKAGGWLNAGGHWVLNVGGLHGVGGLLGPRRGHPFTGTTAQAVQRMRGIPFEPRAGRASPAGAR